ncbi:MAG: DUF998 domain-containing protein [Candidatus Kariarchaeaceae archaeon]
MSIYSMFISAIVFAIGNAIAMILYPDYSFSSNYFSDLGIRRDIYVTSLDTMAYAPPHPEIFNITLYICGFFIIPFFPAATSIVKNNEGRNTLLILCALSGVSIGPLLIGVGIYDVASNFDAHVDFATNLMFMIGVTSLLWAMAITSLDKDASYKQFKTWILDPFFVIFIMFVAWILVWGRPDIIPFNKVSYQIYQKLVALSFIPYYSLVGLRLYKILNYQQKEINLY